MEILSNLNREILYLFEHGNMFLFWTWKYCFYLDMEIFFPFLSMEVLYFFEHGNMLFYLNIETFYLIKHGNIFIC